jgi:excisionase family DNA binding protein
MEAMEVKGKARRPKESADDSADRSVDALLRPGPGEAESAGELLARIDAILGGPRRVGRLIGPDGDEVEIPAAALAALRLVAAAMAKGQAVTVAPHDLELTTQEAADLLHVSRPHLIKLLDKGELPHHRMSDDPNSHRRVLLKDVMAYRQQRQQTRRGLLRDLTQASQDIAGGYR